MAPLFSCVLPTGDRPHFLTRAISYFQHQTYTHRELIVIDDGKIPYGDPGLANVTYMRLAEKLNLGAKLNLGLTVAKGDYLQKMDDDDYYHPQFLETAATVLKGKDPNRTLALSDRFLVLIAETGKVVSSGDGWRAGGTFCFYRELIANKAFRDLPRAVDWWFLQDHQPQIAPLRREELYMLVRHNDGHTWNTFNQENPTLYFQRKPKWEGKLSQVMSPDNFNFYMSLATPVCS